MQDIGLLKLQQELTTWQASDKEKRSFSVCLGGKEIEVTLLKGHMVYDSMTPSKIEDSINLSTTDVTIQDLVKKHFPIAYSFPTKTGTYDIHFFGKSRNQFTIRFE